jgi:F-type H+-transporting ATPase subunit b
MKNWLTYLVFTNSQTKSISLNTNIFETNLINIIILLVLLVYLLGNFLNENLSFRQEQIENSIKTSEKRLNESKDRLNEIKSQWSQARIIIEDIKEQTQQTKENLLKSEFNEINHTLSQRFINLLTILYYREQQVLSTIILQVSELALKEVTKKLKTKLLDKDQSIIINNKITRLGSHS